MSSPVLAGPPGDCCFKAVPHVGTAVGQTEVIGGLNTYVSLPPKGQDGPKRVIIFYADVFGPLFRNNMLIQDYFATYGFTVVGPDYFFGDAIYKHTEPDFDRMAWIGEYMKKAKAAVPAWLTAIKDKYGADTKYSVVGYCFGAPFTMELAATDFVTAAAFAHPAFLNEGNFEKITAPLLLSCAEVDSTFPLAARRRAEDILVERKAKYSIQVFSGVEHGFARGDPAVPDQKYAKEESARGIITWFDRFSKGEEAK